MVPDQSPSDGSSYRSPTEGRFLANAIIGALAGFLLGFVPLSPLLGGGLAGYLQGGSRSDGLTVGAAAGVVALVPALLAGALFAVVFILGGPGGRGFLVFLLFGALFLVAGAAYFVGLSAAGGWLGIYLRESLHGSDGARSQATAGEAAGDPIVDDQHTAREAREDAAPAEGTAPTDRSESRDSEQ